MYWSVTFRIIGVSSVSDHVHFTRKNMERRIWYSSRRNEEWMLMNTARSVTEASADVHRGTFEGGKNGVDVGLHHGRYHLYMV